MYNNEIADAIRENNHGNKSNTRRVLSVVNENGYEYDVSEIIIETLAEMGVNTPSLASVCNKIGQLTLRKVNLENAYDNRQTVKIGMDLVHIAAEHGLCYADKEGVGSEAPWHIYLDGDFSTWAETISPKKLKPAISDTPYEWTSQTLYYGDGQEIDIVKKARRYKMLHHYKLDGNNGNQEWYDALNRLNRQGFKVNEELLEVACAGHPYLDTVEEGPVFNKKVIASKSRTTAQTRVIEEAKERVGKTSYWLYQMDTRGRAYTVQSRLSPMGIDLSKALLRFSEPKQIDLDHFKWNCANHAGEDKLSFQGRIKWFDDNQEELYKIGCGEVTDLFESVGEKEKKSKWQFLAFCMEWVKIRDYLDEYGIIEGFKSGLLSGSDGTNQGLQIISMLAKDDKMAPYVNISDSGTGQVGDIYAFIGWHLSENIRNNWPKHKAQIMDWSYNNKDTDDSEWTLNEGKVLNKVLDLYPTGHKMWRRISKRLCMTLCYSGTAYGFGEMTMEDKADHGCKVVSSLSMLECILIGRVAFDTCKAEIDRGMKILKWLQEGVSFLPDNQPMMTWRLPDGFLAFSVKEKEKHGKVSGKVGNRRVNLKVYIPTGKMSKRGHENAVSPQIIHSLDGYILRQIVNGMPVEANVTTLHDCFSTDFCHTEDLRLQAMLSYAKASRRDEFERMMAQAFGVHRELPDGGTWTVEDLVDAIYLVC